MSANLSLVPFQKALIEQIQAYLLKNRVSEKNPSGTRIYIYDLMGHIQEAGNVSDLWTLISKASVPPELATELVKTWDRVLAENKQLVASTLQSVKSEKGEREESRKKDKAKEKEKEKENEKEEEAPMVRQQFPGYFFMWDRDGTSAKKIGNLNTYELLHPEALELFIQKIFDEGYYLAIISTGNNGTVNQDPLIKKLLESPILQRRYGESLKEKIYSIAYPALSRSFENLVKNSNLQALLESDKAFEEIGVQIDALPTSTPAGTPEEQIKLVQKNIFIEAICCGRYENGQLTYEFGKAEKHSITFDIPEDIRLKLPLGNGVVAVFDLRKFIETRDFATNQADLKHLQVLQALAQKNLVLDINDNMRQFGLLEIEVDPSKEYFDITPDKIKFADDKPSVIAWLREFGFPDAVLATNECSESVKKYYRNVQQYPSVYKFPSSAQLTEKFGRYTRKDWDQWDSDLDGVRVLPAGGEPVQDGVIYVKFREDNPGVFSIQYTISLVSMYPDRVIEGVIFAEDLTSINERYQMPRNEAELLSKISLDGRCAGLTAGIKQIVEKEHAEIHENTRLEIMQIEQEKWFRQDQTMLDTHLSEIAAQFGDRGLEADLRQMQELCVYVAKLSGQIEEFKQDIETNIGEYFAGRFQKSYILVLNNNEYEVSERAYDVSWAVITLGEKAQIYQKNRSLATLYALQMAVSALKEKISESESKSKRKYSTLSEKIPQIEAQLGHIISAQLAIVETAVSRNEGVVSPVVQSDPLSLSSGSLSSASSSSSSSSFSSFSLSSSLSIEGNELSAKEEKALIFYEGERFRQISIAISRFLEGSSIWKYSNISEFLRKKNSDIIDLVETALLSNQYKFSENQIIITITHRELGKEWCENIILKNIYITFPLTEDIRVRYDLAKLAEQREHGWIHLQCLVGLAEKGIVPEVNDKMYSNGLLTFMNRKTKPPKKIKAEDILIVSDKLEVINFVSQFGVTGTPSSAESTRIAIHQIYLTAVTQLLNDLESKIKSKERGYTSFNFSSRCPVDIGGEVFEVPDRLFYCWWALKDFYTILSTAKPYCSAEVMVDNLSAIQNSVIDKLFGERKGFGYDKDALKAFCKNVSQQIAKMIAQTIDAIKAYFEMRMMDPNSSEKEKFLFKCALFKLDAGTPTDLKAAMEIFEQVEHDAKGPFGKAELVNERYPLYAAILRGEKKFESLWGWPSLNEEIKRVAQNKDKIISDFFDSKFTELQKNYPLYVQLKKKDNIKNLYESHKAALYAEQQRAVEEKNAELEVFLRREIIDLLKDKYPLCAQLFHDKAKIYDFTELKLIDEELGGACLARDQIVVDFLKAEAVKLGEQYPLYCMLVREKRVEELDEEQEAQLKEELKRATDAKHEKIKDFLIGVRKDMFLKNYPSYAILLQNDAAIVDLFGSEEFNAEVARAAASGDKMVSDFFESKISKLSAQYPLYVALVRGEAAIHDLFNSGSFLEEVSLALRSDNKIVSNFLDAKVLKLEAQYPLYVALVLEKTHLDGENHKEWRKEWESAARNGHDTIRNFLMEKNLQARYPLYGALIRGEKRMHDVLEDVVESLGGFLLNPESIVHEEALFRANDFLNDEIRKLSSLYPLYVRLVLKKAHVEDLGEADKAPLQKELQDATAAGDNTIKDFLAKQIAAIDAKKEAKGKLEGEEPPAAAPVAPSASSGSSSSSSSSNAPSNSSGPNLLGSGGPLLTRKEAEKVQGEKGELTKRKLKSAAFIPASP